MTNINQQLEKQVYKPFDDELDLGDHILLKCSACSAPLLDIQITRPKLPVVNKIRAVCWRCGDKSYDKVIKGGFHHTGTKLSTTGNIETDGLPDGTIDVTFHTLENKSRDDGTT